MQGRARRDDSRPARFAFRIRRIHALTGIYSVTYIECMKADAFSVLADPTRRRILQEIDGSERSVSELVAGLEASQPTISKHLRVLREAGFVASRTVRQQ